MAPNPNPNARPEFVPPNPFRFLRFRVSALVQSPNSAFVRFHWNSAMEDGYSYIRISPDGSGICVETGTYARVPVEDRMRTYVHILPAPWTPNSSPFAHEQRVTGSGSRSSTARPPPSGFGLVETSSNVVTSTTTTATKFRHKRKYVAHARARARPSCTHCGYLAASKSKWLAHWRGHTGEKPFACDACKRRFRSNGQLKIHVRTHTGERPFECDVCGKRFAQSSNLICHRRIHTGEKPFGCRVCGKCFNQSSNMKTHQKVHGIFW